MEPRSLRLERFSPPAELEPGTTRPVGEMVLKRLINHKSCVRFSQRDSWSFKANTVTNRCVFIYTVGY